MRCENISEYLSAYVENDLEPGLRLNVDQHLETCEACRADLAAINDLYGSLSEDALLMDAPVGLADGVMRRLRVDQMERRKSAKGWFASLSRGWQFTTAGVGVAVVLAVVAVLGPFHEGVTGGYGKFPWSAPQAVKSTPPTITVAGSTAGFHTAGVPDDLLLDVSIPRAGGWKVIVRTSEGMTVSSEAAADPSGGYDVWQTTVPGATQQRISVRMQPGEQAAVHEVSIRVQGPGFSDAAAISVWVPVQTAPAPGSPLQWRTTQATTLRQALATLAAYRGYPISAPADALDQSVAVNAAGVNADDMVDAVAAAASLKADRSESACNLHR